MWDQAAQDKLQAARDKSNYDAGARYTNVYFKRAYGYQDGDLVEAGASAAGTLPPAPVSFADAALSASHDPLQAHTDALTAAGAPEWAALVAQIQTLVDEAPSLGALQKTLTQAYGGLDSDQLVKLMAAALALAELKGMDAARAEA